MILKNKTILITGASQGIGRALAEKLADEGVNIILVARTEDKLKQFIEKFGSQHRYFACDLSKPDEIFNLSKSITPQPDILINVAGVGVYKNHENITLEDWHNSFSINITAPFLLTKYLLPKFLVLNIGSGLGTIPNKGKSAYVATKFALRGWTLSLAEEFENKLPKFCLITLGSTITNFGGKSIEQRQAEFAQGHAYFPVEWVANKLMEILKEDNRETEITLFPGDYGFGTWTKT